MSNFRFQLAVHSQYSCHTCYKSVKTGNIVLPFPGGCICSECLTKMSDIFSLWYNSQERIDLEESYNNKVSEKSLLKDVYQAVVKDLKKSLKHLPIVSEYVPGYGQGTVISLRTDEKHLYSKSEDAGYMIYAALYISKEHAQIYLLKPLVSLVHCIKINGQIKTGIYSSKNVPYVALGNSSDRSDMELVNLLNIADPDCFDRAIDFMESQAALLATALLNKDRKCDCTAASCPYNKHS